MLKSRQCTIIRVTALTGPLVNFVAVLQTLHHGHLGPQMIQPFYLSVRWILGL